MSNNLLGEIIETLKELRRMHQLNFELLDQLNVACGWVLENHIDLPNKEKLASLLSKGTTLLEEINGKSQSDGFLQRRKSDDNLTASEIDSSKEYNINEIKRGRTKIEDQVHTP